MEVRVVMGTEFSGRGTPNLGTTQRPGTASATVLAYVGSQSMTRLDWRAPMTAAHDR